MGESFDFEIVPTRRGDMMDQIPDRSPGCDQLTEAVANHFGQILDIAASVVEIQKMQVQADACVRMLQEQRQTLEKEAEAYVKRLNAETHSTVSKAEVIRNMMSDYYRFGQNRLSGEEFSKIISDVLDHMGTF